MGREAERGPDCPGPAHNAGNFAGHLREEQRYAEKTTRFCVCYNAETVLLFLSSLLFLFPLSVLLFWQDSLVHRTAGQAECYAAPSERNESWFATDEAPPWLCAARQKRAETNPGPSASSTVAPRCLAMPSKTARARSRSKAKTSKGKQRDGSRAKIVPKATRQSGPAGSGSGYAPRNRSYVKMSQANEVLKSVRPRVVSNPNTYAGNSARQLVTSHEAWEASLLTHLGNPMHSYHLPGIDTTGLAYQPLFYPNAAWTTGRDTDGASGGPGAPAGQEPAGMVTLAANDTSYSHIRMSEFDRQMESNYFKFEGHVIDQLNLRTDTAGEFNAIIAFNPLDPVNPVIMFNWADGTSVWGSGASYKPWTNSPFVAQRFPRPLNGATPWPADISVGRQPDRRGPPPSRDGSSDRWSTVSGASDTRGPAPKRAPQLMYDATNFYYNGGCEMVVKMVGANAFTAYSSLARSDDTTITRFWTTEDDPNDTTTFDYGSTIQFSPGHNVAYAAHTGSKWALSTYWSDFSDDIAQDRVKLALSTGLPFVHFKYSVPQGQSTSPYLQVTAQSWMGVAPCTLRYAGAASNRTVPLSLPAWVSYCRARGATGRDEVAAATGALSRTVKRLASVPSESKVLNAVAANPGAATRALTPTAKTVGDVGNVLFKLLESVTPGMAKALPTLGRLGFDAILRSMGSRPQRMPLAISERTGSRGPIVEEVDD